MQPNDNPYEFIMDPSQQQNNSVPGQSFLKSPNKRTIIGVVFTVIVLIVAVSVISFISSLSKQDNSNLINVVAYQTELIRVSDLGLDESNDPNTRAQISTLRSFLQTDSTEITAYLAANGVELTPAQIASRLDPNIDSALETAAIINSYDEALLNALSSLNGKYKASLQAAIDENSPSSTLKAILSQSASNILDYEGPVPSE